MWKSIAMLSSIAGVLLVGVAIAADQQTTETKQERDNQAVQQPANQQPTTQQPVEQTTENRQNSQAQQNERAFLGVEFQPVPRAVASQLSSAFPHIARGVLIHEVLPDSPAAKAGVKPDDIVTEVNNKPIRSADSLMMMIGHDKPGQKLALQVVRDSKAEKLNVTLGERPNQAVIRGQEPEHARESATSSNGPNSQESAGNAEEELESFDSMSLQRTGKDQYKAEISFRDKQGKIDSRSFQGSREQIRKDITSQTDLPRSESHQLLGALRLPVEFNLQNAPQSTGTEQNSAQPNNRPENQKSSR